MRYIPLTSGEKDEILSTIGASSVDELFKGIPEEFLLKDLLDIPGPLSEPEVLSYMKSLAAKNQPASLMPTFLGGGSYNHFIPSAVDHLTGRSEWYSAYTPYQPEISQGTLQAIYEFQTYIATIFGMEISNASMYDGASALAEAVLMACRISKKDEVIISNLVHPRWRDVVNTFCQFHKIKIIETKDHRDGATEVAKLAEVITDNTAAVVVQSPNFFGTVEDLEAIGALCQKNNILFVAGVAEALSLGMLKPAGAFGADIVVGEGQSLGLPQAFGGPYLGLFATKKKYLRQMPGRLCGRTTDSDGKDGFVLTLAAREQHIRRERATSNICTNQALCALRATIYLSLLGKEGFAKVAQANFNAGNALEKAISGSKKVSLMFRQPFFNETVVTLNESAEAVNKKLIDSGIIGGLDISRFYPDMKNAMLLSVTEQTTPTDIEKLMKVLES